MAETRILGHRFGDPALLERALTHRSAGHHNNERLEFLGDALLNLFVAELVYEQHPRADEGEMTRLRAALVNGGALAVIARAEHLGDHLRLGPGELKSGGFRRDSILADALEALLAAIYADAGWQACRDTVRRLFGERVATIEHAPKDAKTRLQEWLQARSLALPTYELVATTGEEHARVFEVSCRIAALDLVTGGTASGRRTAEQVAAQRALEAIAARDKQDD